MKKNEKKVATRIGSDPTVFALFKSAVHLEEESILGFGAFYRKR